MAYIEAENLQKTFKVFERPKGARAMLGSLIRRKYTEKKRRWMESHFPLKRVRWWDILGQMVRENLLRSKCSAGFWYQIMEGLTAAVGFHGKTGKKMPGIWEWFLVSGLS